ncbi:hypothetical protein MAR_038500 [Mya arenaria]|uniref:Tyrosine-protein phosphatase domain-containing protein n=1 Tax=Mya arenaria TaxID=6604 RepID=A0ABY7FVR7_MYAAR|nr:hypothetical protein MAR_038500 [Mya arenaria]
MKKQEHKKNGADRSGLFCVASTVLERMKIEHDVAIAQVIKEMRNYGEQIFLSVVRIYTFTARATDQF